MKKKRAVAYVRVSSGSRAQLHSYEFQSDYWHGRFENDPTTELVGFYADKGISGRSMAKRPQFLIMLQDAREGKFDVIYTKSISRFARNTTDLLSSVRELREIGVEVIFENENISTLSSTSDVYMTIAATLAENELHEDSVRQKWSFQHRFQNGWISLGTRMYGYRMGANNTFEIIEDEAAVVRRIFGMYLDGSGATVISRTLNAEGLVNSHGNPWTTKNILEIIANEKYAGDALMGKHVRIDGIQYDNKDGRYSPQYFVEGCHEPIVSHEVFDKAQELKKQRQNDVRSDTKTVTEDLSGLIECGVCGKHFHCKVNNRGQKYESYNWICSNQLKHTVAACDNTRIKDAVIKEKIVEAYNRFITERPRGTTVITMENAIKKLQREERDLAALAVKRLIPDEAYRKEQRRIKGEIAAIEAKLNAQRLAGVQESDFVAMQDFDANRIRKFITKVIVNKWTVTFVFYNGVEMTAEYSNGTPGNKPGWNKKEEA